MNSQEFTTEELATEEWRDVVGYEGYYRVSNLGRVMRSGGSPRCSQNRIIKPRTTNRGYLTVGLSRGSVRRATVHRLVARAFIGPCPDGMNVNHKDTLKVNNRSSNLEYLTVKQNIQHAFTAGIYGTGDKHPNRIRPDRMARGADQGLSKLTDWQVREIRTRYAQGGIAQHALASEYKVSLPTVNRVILRATWKHVV